MRGVFTVVLCFCLWPCSAWAQALRVMGFDVESRGARREIVDDLIRAAQGVDIWDLSEVQDETWGMLFEQAAEDGEAADFQRILGTTGGGDRLLIMLALFQLVGDSRPSSRQLLLAQIQRMEEELSALKILVEQMPQ
jgi:hypothetical protein